MWRLLLLAGFWQGLCLAADAPRPEANGGENRVYVFGTLSEFQGGNSGDAMAAYESRARRDFPKAKIIQISPLTEENIRKAYQEIESGNQTEIHVYIHTHGRFEDGKYRISLDGTDEKILTGSGEILGSLNKNAHYYLMTCHGGGAILSNSFPKAASIFVASPAHLETRSVYIASALFGLSKSEHPLPESGLEFWQRSEETNLKNHVLTKRDIPTVQLPIGTGCVLDGKRYGGICADTYPKYQADRETAAETHLVIGRIHP